MKISKEQLFSFSFLSGITLLYSYYYFLKDKSSASIDKYWGGITGTTRNVYKISMLLCVISMLSIIYKIYKSDKKNFKNEFYGLFLLIVPSMLYLPFTIMYIKKHNTIRFIRILLTLFYVALGSIILYRQNPSWDTGYLAFHLVVLDLTYWSYSFFSTK